MPLLCGFTFLTPTVSFLNCFESRLKLVFHLMLYFYPKFVKLKSPCRLYMVKLLLRTYWPNYIKHYPYVQPVTLSHQKLFKMSKDGSEKRNHRRKKNSSSPRKFQCLMSEDKWGPSGTVVLICGWGYLQKITSSFPPLAPCFRPLFMRKRVGGWGRWVGYGSALDGWQLSNMAEIANFGARYVFWT